MELDALKPLTMWRIELLHPVVVHLPLVLLLLVTCLEFVDGALCLFRRKHSESHPRTWMSHAVVWLLPVGTCGAWGAIWSGKEAEDVVNRVICDPTITQLHETWANRSAYAFSAAVFFLLLRSLNHRRIAAGDDNTRALSRFLNGVFSCGALGLMIGGTVALIETAHLGGQLVYQQGAATYRPTDECTEFE